MSARKPKSKRKMAQTLDELGGAASNVSFVKEDARAAAPLPQLSKTKLKQAFEWDLSPQWPVLTGEEASAALRHIGEACAASSSARPAALCVGRAAVWRALRRKELAAILLAREGGPPLLSAHLAALAQESQTPTCLVACSSAQLGQPFGLLRASIVGLRAAHCATDEPLVVLLRDAAQQQRPAGPLPWLEAARALTRSSDRRRAVPSESQATVGEAAEEAIA